MFGKRILHTFIRGIVMYVYFITFPLKAYSGVLIFKILICIVVIIPCCADNANIFSELLPTAQKNDQRCCLQRL